MSWETLVTGHFSFKSGVPDSVKHRIIEELEEVLEAELKWNSKWELYEVHDVNWSSHVDEDRIKEFHRKWKHFFKMFSVSLYYLSDADYSEYNDSKDQDVVDIAAAILDSLIESAESGDCEEANNTLEILVELLKGLDSGGRDKEAIKRQISNAGISRALEALKPSILEDGLSRELLLELVNALDGLGIQTAGLRKFLLVASL